MHGVAMQTNSGMKSAGGMWLTPQKLDGAPAHAIPVTSFARGGLQFGSKTVMFSRKHFP